jgi:hypothetical protein
MYDTAIVNCDKKVVFVIHSKSTLTINLNSEQKKHVNIADTTIKTKTAMAYSAKNLQRSRMGCQSNRHLPLQVSDIWHKIKGHIGPNLAFLYGGHDLGWKAIKKTYSARL